MTTQVTTGQWSGINIGHNAARCLSNRTSKDKSACSGHPTRPIIIR